MSRVRTPRPTTTPVPDCGQDPQLVHALGADHRTTGCDHAAREPRDIIALLATAVPPIPAPAWLRDSVLDCVRAQLPTPPHPPQSVTKHADRPLRIDSWWPPGIDTFTS